MIDKKNRGNKLTDNPRSKKTKRETLFFSTERERLFKNSNLVNLGLRVNVSIGRSSCLVGERKREKEIVWIWKERGNFYLTIGAISSHVTSLFLNVKD